MSARETAQVIGRDAGTPVDEGAIFEHELVPLVLPGYRLALGMLLDRSLAEDAVQNASLRAWDHRRKRLPGTALGPWFLAIVANCCRDARRSRWTRVALSPAMADARAGGAEDVGTSIDVRRALRTLPRKQRLAVILRFYLDLPYDEVATILGCSVNAAKLRVSRAADSLRRELRDFEERQ